MKTTILWGLVGLNALLLAMFVSHYVGESAARAQVAQQPAAAAARGPGEFIICPGAVTGIGSEIVYIIDTLNGQLGAIVYDVNGNRLDTMPATDLNRVFQAAAGPVGAPARTGPGAAAPGAQRRY